MTTQFHSPQIYIPLTLSLALLTTIPQTHARPLTTYLQRRDMTSQSNKPDRTALIGSIIGILGVFLAFFLVGILALRHRARVRASKRRAGIHSNPAVRWVGAELYARETNERVKRARRSSPNVDVSGVGQRGGIWRFESEGSGAPPAYGAAPPSYHAVALGVPDRAVLR